MARGVPSEIRVGSRTYTCRQIADGAGLHISLVSRIFRGKRAPSLFAATRLAGFFRITIEELLAVVNVQVRMPRFPRRRGRVVGRVYDPASVNRYGEPVLLKTYASSQTSEPCSRTLPAYEDILPVCLRGDSGSGGNRL